MSKPPAVRCNEELLALAVRCEQARVADRELDALIGVACDPEPTARVIYGKGYRYFLKPGPGRIPMHVCFGRGVEFGMLPQLRRYTASLDAAMTLVPEGLMWTMDSWSLSRWSAGIWRRQTGWLIYSDPDRQCPTPALALCAAALRARAHPSSPTNQEGE